MKIKTFIFLLSAASGAVYGQQTTLQHFDPSVVTPIASAYGGAEGYLTGHNDYGDEEFAEKYEIQGNGMLHGISAIHLGQDGTPGSILASYRAYSVGSAGLPETALANKNVSYSAIPVNGQLTTVLFDNPVNVSSSFFVSFRLGDYLHGGLGTKRIAIAHSPEGTRPASDFTNFGRNVIRWHSHGAAVWKDYRTENFSDASPAIYFALFPLVELSSLAVVDFNKKGNVGAVYPNPSNGNFIVPVKTASGGSASFKLFDMSGKMIADKQANLSSGANEFKFSEENLQKGNYILLIKTPEGNVSQKVSIR